MVANRSGRVLALFLVVVLGASAIATKQTLAFPEDARKSCAQNIEVVIDDVFNGDSFFSGIGDGGNDWANIRGLSGNPIHVFWPDGASNTPAGTDRVIIRPDNNLANSVNGSAQCDVHTWKGVQYDGVIRLNRQMFLSEGRTSAEVRDTVAHEMGHILGLTHSGKNETPSLTFGTQAATLNNYRTAASSQPAMRTCTSGQGRAVRQDDRSSLNHRAAQDGHTILSNGGFENDLQDWFRYRTPVNPVSISFQGSKGAGIDPASGETEVVSFMQWSNLSSTPNNPNAGAGVLKPDFRIQRSGANQGSVFVQIMRRKVHYAGGQQHTDCTNPPTGPKPYETGKNEWIRTLGNDHTGFTILKTKVLTPNQIPVGSWKHVTGGMNIPILPGNWRGADYMFVLNSDMRTSAFYTNIFVDNVRMINGDFNNP